MYNIVSNYYKYNLKYILIFSKQKLSKQRKYTSGSFSFNIDGGRCNDCKGEGETIEILITLNPLEDGPQTFNLNTISNGEIYDQSISVNVAEKEGFSIGDLSDFAKYLASAIVALIILIFITLIVKVSRKPAKAEF